jgi:hypothetical protein
MIRCGVHDGSLRVGNEQALECSVVVGVALWTQSGSRINETDYLKGDMGEGPIELVSVAILITENEKRIGKKRTNIIGRLSARSFIIVVLFSVKREFCTKIALAFL